MPASNRRLLSVGAALAMVLLVGAGLAWACTPAATLTATPNRAEPGDPVTVKGYEFPVGAPISVFWQSAQGEKLAEATGADFEAQVTIPTVPDGTYILLAQAYGPDGRVSGKASATFTVGGESQEPVTSGKTSGASTSQGSGGSSTTATDGGDSLEVAAPGKQSGGDRPASSGAEVTSAGDSVFTAGLPAAVPAATAPGRDGRTGADRSTDLARPAWAADDLFSGFEPVDGPAVSVLDSREPATPGRELGLGVALLTAGLTALVAGAAAATLMRRKATAEDHIS